jgi:hypothetical protein
MKRNILWVIVIDAALNPYNVLITNDHDVGKSHGLLEYASATPSPGNRLAEMSTFVPNKYLISFPLPSFQKQAVNIFRRV